MGGLEVRSACMLEPLTFLATAAVMLPHQDAILSPSDAGADDTAVSNIKTTWSCPANTIEPSELSKHIHRAWTLQSQQVDQVRFKVVITPHAGSWLYASPLTSVDLLLSDEAIRVTNAYQLGTNICQHYTCVCGATVDARGLHGLACRKSGPRHIRHSQLNDLIRRAVK